MNEIPSVVEVPMSARAAGSKLPKLPRFCRLAHVPDEKAFGKRLIIAAAPTWRNPLERGNHLPVRDFHLNRPGIFRSRNKSRELRCTGIGDIENAPAPMPKMGDVQIPPPVHLL